MMNQDLVDLVNSGEAWAFVGSGPSIDAGLASWSRATTAVPHHLQDSEHRDALGGSRRWRRALEAGDYPQALQVAEDLVGRPILLRAFAAALGKPGEDAGVYDLLKRWPFKNFVTTNYDSLLFDRTRAVEPTLTLVENSEESFRLITREPENVVLRIHGDLTEGTSCVLTQRDYDREYGPGGRVGGLALDLLRDRRFVFVGFGFSDPDVKRIIRLAAQVSNPAKPHFAFLGFRKEDVDHHTDLAAEFRVIVIPYRVSADGSHGDLRRVLAAYDWSVLGRKIRHIVSSQIVGVQSPGVGALQLLNECLASGDPDQPPIKRVFRAITLAALRQGAKTGDDILAAMPRVLPIQAPASRPIASLVVAELGELEKVGQVTGGDGTYALTPEGMATARAVAAEGELLRTQFRRSVEARIREKLESGETISETTDCVVTYLDQSCLQRSLGLGQLIIGERPMGAEVHAVNVLSGFSSATSTISSRDAAIAAIACVGEMLSSPSEIEKRYLGRLLQSSFACQLMGLEPESLRVRREDLKRTVFLSDSNVLAALLAKGSVGHDAVRALFEALEKCGSQVAVTPRLMEEASAHADWARWAFSEFGPTGPQILDILERRNGFRPNVFVAGYVARRNKHPGLSWQVYLADCLGVVQVPKRIRLEVVRQSCERYGNLLVIDPAEYPDLSADFFARCDDVFGRIKERRHRRNTYRNDDQVRTEAEVVIIVDELTDLGDALGRRALFVSNTRLLDGLPGVGIRVTIDPDGLWHWLSAVARFASDETRAFEAMVYRLYQEGIVLFDRAAFRRVFDPLVTSSKDRFDQVLAQYRSLVEEVLGPNPENAFAEVDDLTKPIVLRGIEGRLFERVKAELDREKARRVAAETTRTLSDAERAAYQKLLAEKAERRARAFSKRRAAASKPKKKRRR